MMKELRIMTERTIKIESTSYHFSIEKDKWHVSIAKSQTNVNHFSQLTLLKEKSNFFAPIEIKEEKDLFRFSFFIDEKFKKWKDVKRLNRNDKLRLLCNIAQLKRYIDSRTTFFLHPSNLVFDKNLNPIIIYRGFRQVVPPFEMNEERFLNQYKCLAIALFSKKHTFDDLYEGTLQNVIDTEFERKINEQENLEAFIVFLEESYQKEQTTIDKTMKLVPQKKFRLFKKLSIVMIIFSILLAIPLVYSNFIKIPYQERLLLAHREFLLEDYGEVINQLQREKPEKLPHSSKYILSFSYIKTEKLSDEQKVSIMKNVSLKSDESYLLYWIYNGRGDFEKSNDIAQYMDDPQLIVYSLLKQMEQVKSDPKINGEDREKKVKDLESKLKTYKEEYKLDSSDGKEIKKVEESVEQPVPSPVENEEKVKKE